MRASLSLLALPALTLAEQQQPLLDRIKGLWANVASSIPTPKVPDVNIPNPINVAAAGIAAVAVTPLNHTNFHSTIRDVKAHSTGEPAEWLVYIDGGAKSCYGLCNATTTAWNQSTALLVAQPAPKRPHLASVNCESDRTLCSLLSVVPPAVYHILLPAPPADPVVRYISLNTTDVTPKEIASISTERGFEKYPVYKGVWEPFTGLLAQYGIHVPIAHVLATVGLLPSWAPMIIISMLSRTLMGRGLGTNPNQARRSAAPPAAATN